MINETHICINGEYYGPIGKLTATPSPGKKIAVEGDALEIRCSLRYHGKEITNLYIDLIREKNKNEK